MGAASVTWHLSDIHTRLYSRLSTPGPICGQNVKSEREAESEARGVCADDKAEPAMQNYEQSNEQDVYEESRSVNTSGPGQCHACMLKWCHGKHTGTTCMGFCINTTRPYNRTASVVQEQNRKMKSCWFFGHMEMLF